MLVQEVAIPAATKVDGFDIILLGHDHQEQTSTITNEAGNEVVVIDARTGARLVGRADIKLKRNADGYNKEISSSLIDMNKVAADKNFVEYFQKDVDLINNYVEIGRASCRERVCQSV